MLRLVLNWPLGLLRLELLRLHLTLSLIGLLVRLLRNLLILLLVRLLRNLLGRRLDRIFALLPQIDPQSGNHCGKTIANHPTKEADAVVAVPFRFAICGAERQKRLHDVKDIPSQHEY